MPKKKHLTLEELLQHDANKLAKKLITAHLNLSWQPTNSNLYITHENFMKLGGVEKGTITLGDSNQPVTWYILPNHNLIWLSETRVKQLTQV